MEVHLGIISKHKMTWTRAVYLVTTISKWLFKYIVNYKLNTEFCIKKYWLIMLNLIFKGTIMLFFVPVTAAEPSLVWPHKKMFIFFIEKHCYTQNMKLIIELCSHHILHSFFIDMLLMRNNMHFHILVTP